MSQYHPQEPKKSREWCEHLTMGLSDWVISKQQDERVYQWTDTDDWKQCPICLAPRPEAKSLRERLAEKLKSLDMRTSTLSMNASYDTEKLWLDLSDTAIKFLEGER